MTSILSGRHKYLTYKKNTKKGRRCCKKLSLRERPHFLPLKTGTALSPQAKAVQHPVRSRFFEMISFFLHSVSANLMIAKKRGNARKTPEIVRFRGVEAMISFLASQYGSGTRIQNLGLRVCWYRLWSSCRRKPFQALAGLSRSEFACGVSKNKRTAKAVLLFLYRAAEKDISRKSLWHKGFRYFRCFFCCFCAI